jgi:hypothetical protein
MRTLEHRSRRNNPILLLPWVALLLLAVILVPPAAANQDEEATGISVADGAICLSVEDHQAVAAADSFSADVGQLACWTRIVNGADQEIVHAWIHEGTTRARVELSIGSDSWRTYSTKQILSGWTGDWEVKIMTPEGVVLHSIPFRVN